MYLAEDRIMCLELLVKRNCAYKLAYIPGAKAITDPPKDITTLIKQRRRWINGSTFATFHVL
jgi:chitin synthase